MINIIAGKNDNPHNLEFFFLYSEVDAKADTAYCFKYY